MNFSSNLNESVEKSDIVFICVGTPTKKNSNSADLSQVYAVGKEISKSIKSYITSQMPDWKRQYPGIEDMNIAVMGCIVNGPGESKHANIGISLPGNNEDPSAPVYIDGKKFTTLQGVIFDNQFIDILQSYIEDKYS